MRHIKNDPAPFPLDPNAPAVMKKLAALLNEMDHSMTPIKICEKFRALLPEVQAALTPETPHAD